MTDFLSRSELLDQFCSDDKQRRSDLILSSRDLAEKLHRAVNDTIQKILQINHEDPTKDEEDENEENNNNNNSNHHRDPNAATSSSPIDLLTSPTTPPVAAGSGIKSILSFAERTLSFVSPSQTSPIVDEQRHRSTSHQEKEIVGIKKKTKSERLVQQLLDQKTALQHELETLRKQQYAKKLGIQYKAAEIARLRNLSENILPRAKKQCGASSMLSLVVGECNEGVEESLIAAQKREMELRQRLYDISQHQTNENDKENNSNQEAIKNKSTNPANMLQSLEKTYEHLLHEKQQKQDLITNFEHRKNKNTKIEDEILQDMTSMKQELASLRDKEKFLRHSLASDAIRRVLDARNQPMQLRGRNAHAKLEEAMAFLKAEVVHFGHDVRPVTKALASKDPENMFKQAHNELKLIVGLMLPKSGEGTAKMLNRKQGQTWPLTHELLVDRFPQHKIDVAYVKLQEMVVAWDCLSKSSQEQLTTAHDVINNADVLLMFARHVGDLYQEKRNQMTERATKIASLATGDSVSGGGSGTTTTNNNHQQASSSSTSPIPIHNQQQQNNNNNNTSSNNSSRQQSIQPSLHQRTTSSGSNSNSAFLNAVAGGGHHFQNMNTTTSNSRGSSIGVVASSPRANQQQNNSGTPSKQLLQAFANVSDHNVNNTQSGAKTKKPPSNLMATSPSGPLIRK